MAFENPSREEIKTILEQVGNIAVVGLSDKSDRTSYMVSYAMQKRGYRIIPVNPAAAGQTILGRLVMPVLLKYLSLWSWSMYSAAVNTVQRLRVKQLLLELRFCGFNREL